MRLTHLATNAAQRFTGWLGWSRWKFHTSRLYILHCFPYPSVFLSSWYFLRLEFWFSVSIWFCFSSKIRRSLSSKVKLFFQIFFLGFLFLFILICLVAENIWKRSEFKFAVVGALLKKNNSYRKQKTLFFFWVNKHEKIFKEKHIMILAGLWKNHIRPKRKHQYL